MNMEAASSFENIAHTLEERDPTIHSRTKDATSFTIADESEATMQEEAKEINITYFKMNTEPVPSGMKRKTKTNENSELFDWDLLKDGSPEEREIIQSRLPSPEKESTGKRARNVKNDEGSSKEEKEKAENVDQSVQDTIQRPTPIYLPVEQSSESS